MLLILKCLNALLSNASCPLLPVPGACCCFGHTAADYARHASLKHKALQKAIDEVLEAAAFDGCLPCVLLVCAWLRKKIPRSSLQAWVHGMHRQRPDGNFGPYGAA